MPVAAIVPLVVIVVAWVAWITYDILRSEVRYLPKWAWIVVSILSVPVGGIVYLVVGRDPS